MRHQHVMSLKEDRRRGRGKSGLFVLLILLLSISPIAFEGASIVLGKWYSMYGTYWAPRTPVLDALADLWSASKSDMSRRSARALLAGNWRTGLAVPLAISWAAIAALFLRRGH